MAHGSGVRVDGVLVTVMPLGITLACAWATWRTAHRLGDSVSGHGPDADRIADGERDWTVPVAALVFTSGYVATAVLTVHAGVDARRPHPTSPASCCGRWCSAACSAPRASRPAPDGPRCGAPGSPRPWSRRLPPAAPCSPRGSGSASRSSSARCCSTSAPPSTWSRSSAPTAPGLALLALVSLVLVPNATLFSGSYLLGPGFTVGVQTIVSPAEVSVGALPVFPMLAALPDSGATPGLDPLAGAGAPGRRRDRRRPRPAAPSDAALRGGCAARLRGRDAGRGGLRRPRLAGRRSRRARADDRRRPARRLRAGPRGDRLRDRRPAGRSGHHVVAASEARRRSSRLHRVPARLVVLVSGSGTNLQALLDATADQSYGATVVAVGADRERDRGARPGRAGRGPDLRAPGQGPPRPRCLGPGAGGLGGRSTSPTW